MSTKPEPYVDPHKRDLIDDWEGSGAKRNRLTFLKYVRKMADDDRSPLQDAAKQYLYDHRCLTKFLKAFAHSG